MENTIQGFQVSVKSFDEAFRFCQMMSETDLCPDSYKPSTFLNRICGQDQKARLNPENIKKAKEMSVNNIFIACSYGGTLGLNPFQSLQGIAMVNGKPSVYGDTLLGLVRPLCEDFQEWFDDQTGTAFCVIRRKGSQHPIQSKFSYQDAQRAGLTSKKGPWTQYPERMLQMRARGFAIRDAFPDVLSGIITREEAEDYPTQKTAELPQIPQQNNISVSQQNVAPLQVQMQQPATVQQPMNFQTQQEQLNGNS
jgi:hypothetical protein